MNRVQTIGGAILERFHDRFFTMEHIMGTTGISRRYVRDIMALLVNEGLVTKVRKQEKGEKEWGRPISYTITFRLADRKGMAERISPVCLPNTVQDRLWFVIRTLFKRSGIFTLRDLVVLAGVKRNTAHWYLKALKRAGYAEHLQKGGPGVEWRLTQDLGPRRPPVAYSRHKAKGVEKCTAKAGQRRYQTRLFLGPKGGVE